MAHLYSCPLRWGDMDSFGHVNNVIFASYIQEARLALFRDLGRESLSMTVLAAQRLVYAAPLVFDVEPVQIETTVLRVGGSSFQLAFRIFRGETVYLRAVATLVAFDFGVMDKRKLTDEERAALERHLVEETVEPVAFGEPRRDPRGHFPVQVRFSDIDAGGIVSNVQAIELFQEARVGLLANQLGDLAPGSVFPATVVVQQDLEYVHPITYRAAPYDSWTWVSSLGGKSVTVEAEIRDPLDGDRLMARGRFPLVFFDPATGRAIEPSAEIRAILRAALR